MNNSIHKNHLLEFNYNAPASHSGNPFLFHIVRAGYNYCNENFEIIRDKNYPYYTLHILIDGCGFFQIENQAYLLRKGEAFVITPGDAHTYCNFTSTSLGLLWVELTGSNCSELFSYFRSNKLYALRNTQDKKLEKSLYDLLDYLDLHKEMNEYELSGKIYAMLMVLLDTATNVPNVQISSYIEEALTYIDHNFTRQLRIQDIADNLHISHTYLTKLFKKNIGTSPLKYINLKRIEYACYLLQTTSLTCDQISEQIGMYDNAYFYKVFKSVNGVTPIAYRNRRPRG